MLTSLRLQGFVNKNANIAVIRIIEIKSFATYVFNIHIPINKDVIKIIRTRRNIDNDTITTGSLFVKKPITGNCCVKIVIHIK